MNRTSIKTKDAKLMNVWVPDELIELIDQGVALTDSDRSKFTRVAIRERLQALGIRPTAHNNEDAQIGTC